MNSVYRQCLRRISESDELLYIYIYIYIYIHTYIYIHRDYLPIAVHNSTITTTIVYMYNVQV